MGNQSNTYDNLTSRIDVGSILSGLAGGIISTVTSWFGGGTKYWEDDYANYTSHFNNANDIALAYLYGIEQGKYPLGDWQINQFHEMFGYRAEAQGHGWKNRIKELSWETMNLINALVSKHLPNADWQPLLIRKPDLDFALEHKPYNDVQTTQTTQTTTNGNTSQPYVNTNPVEQPNSNINDLPPRNTKADKDTPKKMSLSTSLIGLFITLGLLITTIIAFLKPSKKRRY